VCGVSELSPSSTSLDFQMHAKPHGVVVGSPMDSSHYGFGNLPASSYAAPHTYVAAPSSLHHANYHPYYVELDRPRCTCGDRHCVQFSVHDYGRHVALRPGTAAVYPGHQMVYPGEHLQIIRPPLAAHYHHHRHGYPPPPSSAGAHFVPALQADGPYAGPRQMMAAPAGCGDHVAVATSCAPVVNGNDSLTAPINGDDAAPSPSDITRVSVDDAVEPSASAARGTSTTLITAEHDVTPTRDNSDQFSSAATINTMQLYAHSSGNFFRSSITS